MVSRFSFFKMAYEIRLVGNGLVFYDPSMEKLNYFFFILSFNGLSIRTSTCNIIFTFQSHGCDFGLIFGIRS